MLVAMIDVPKDEIDEGAFADEPNGPLHFPLLVRATRRAEPWLHQQRSRRLEQQRVVADGFADPAEDDRLRIVEEPLPGDTVKCLCGANKRPRNGGGVERKAQLAPHCARPREHDHEHPQRTLATSNSDILNKGPIDLALLADQRCRSQKCLALSTGAQPRCVLTNRSR